MVTKTSEIMKDLDILDLQNKLIKLLGESPNTIYDVVTGWHKGSLLNNDGREESELYLLLTEICLRSAIVNEENKPEAPAITFSPQRLGSNFNREAFLNTLQAEDLLIKEINEKDKE